MNDVLQVPMSKELREKATLVAISQGYSSLQETVRVFLTQLADKKIETRLWPTVKEIRLSPKAIKRYNKQTEDIRSGKSKLFTAHSVEELMEHLRKDNDCKN